MNNLPADIYHELQSWLEEDDQRALALVNRMISNQMMKYVRVLSVQGWWWEMQDFERRLRSYFTSEKLRSLIADPYHQLTLLFPVGFDLRTAGYNDISISCKSLTVSVHQLMTSFIQCVNKVQNLTLGFNSFGRPSLTDSELQFIADWINNSNLGLKELEINNYNITNLPVIPSLKSLTIAATDTFSLDGLNISAYSNLRRLKLSSSNGIEDVSSLDGIHELHLLYCHKIQDISGLNHNYKIVIEDCSKITDYSNSFRYSKIIHIRCPSKSMQREMDSFDLSKALEAREIYFWGENCTKPLILPQCSSLRLVQAENLQSPFTLPSEHHIREIIVRDWTGLISFLHFDGIYSVKLINLNISSLEGLGSRNRVVEVDNCPLITDFCPLRHCDKVIIRKCKGFQDIDQIRGVNDLIFSPADINKVPESMEGVTCLILDYGALKSLPQTTQEAGKKPFKELDLTNVAYYHERVEGLKGQQRLQGLKQGSNCQSLASHILSLTFPNTLKKLVINSEVHDLNQQLPLLLASLPHHIAKIEVSVDENSFRPLLEKGEVSFPNFIIEFKKGVHFFRKHELAR